MMSRSSTDDRRLRNSRIFFLLFDGVCSTTMMHRHPSPSIRDMKVTHTRFDSRQQDGRIVWRRVSIFFFFFFYFSFPIHSAEHSSITSDVVATSIRNIDKNSTSTQITRQFSNWSRANSFQREEHPWYVISRKRHYKSVAGSSSTTTWARNENWIRIHVSSISRGRSRDSTFEIESVKTWNCFADLARPVRRLVRAPSDHDRKTQRKRTLEKKRKETTLCFHAFERTIWNYVNIRCSQFDSCITGARVSPNIDNNNNNNNTTVSPYEERWSLRNRFSR